MTAEFSEPVTGFVASDVSVTNGSVAVSGGPEIYTLTVTPSASEDIEILVPADVAQDAAGNGNTASNAVVVTNTIVEDTQRAISGFMLKRANNLASNQPDLRQLLLGNSGQSVVQRGAFNAHATEEGGWINSYWSRGGVWTSLVGSWSDGSSYALATIGAGGSINDGLILGGMLQFDYTDDNNANISGRGWMIGLYFISEHVTQPLFFDGRLLFGKTDNDISPLGTYTDNFDSERWLAQIGITGEFRHKSFTFLPNFNLSYTEDRQLAYTDGLGITIPEQTVHLGQATAGLDFNTPISVARGDLQLLGGVSAIYSTTGGSAASTVTPDYEGGRVRVDLGSRYDMENGGTLRVGAFYDGIGANGYDSYGAKLNWEMHF